MIRPGRSASPRPVLAAVAVALLVAAPAAACELGVSVVQVRDGAEVARLAAAAFTLEWRHSVTLTMVSARYVVGPDGLRQVEERFSAHGPGMAHDGAGWRREGEAFVLPLDRPVDRLILRAAPEHRNRLRAGASDVDLTRWPDQPLEILPTSCPPPERTP